MMSHDHELTLWTGVVFPHDQTSGAAASWQRALVAIWDRETEHLASSIALRTVIMRYYGEGGGGGEGGGWGSCSQQNTH